MIIAGAAMSKPFRRGPFSRIGISVGLPVAPREAAPEVLQQQVAVLRGDWR